MRQCRPEHTKYTTSGRKVSNTGTHTHVLGNNYKLGVEAAEVAAGEREVRGSGEGL